MTNSGQRILVMAQDAETVSAMERLAALQDAELRAVEDVPHFLATLIGWQPSHVLVQLSGDDDGLIDRMAGTATDAFVMLVAPAGRRWLDDAERLGLELGLAVTATLELPGDTGALEAFLSMGGREAATASATATPPAIADRQRLRSALAEGQLFVVYQPRIACATGRLAGFEALLRWRHPEHGAMDARHFIDQADFLGLLDEVTDFVLAQSLGWLAGARVPRDIGLSVNIAASTLAEPTLADRIVHICDRFDIAPGRLTIDVPESSRSAETRMSETIARLRARSIRIALDNFSGANTLFDELVRLPVDEIKLDRRVVMAASHSDEDRRLALATAALARALDIGSVAEGVETLATFRLLKDAGFSLAQGYFIGRPMPPESAASWMGEAV